MKLVLLRALSLLTIGAFAGAEVAAQPNSVWVCPGADGGKDQVARGLSASEGLAKNCKEAVWAPVLYEGQPPGECIAYWRKVIDHQQRIAKESGFLDKQVMYAAGVQIVSCQERLKAQQSEIAAKKK